MLYAPTSLYLGVGTMNLFVDMWNLEFNIQIQNYVGLTPLFCFADHNHGHIDGEFNNRLLRHCQQPYDCLLQKKEKGH